MILLSDTFTQFARPLMAQLGWPTILCHDLEVVDDRIVGYRLRMVDQKRNAVLAFQSLGYRVVAVATRTTTCRCCSRPMSGSCSAPGTVVRAEFPGLPGV